jgi:AcrR family transcriptional regulator
MVNVVEMDEQARRQKPIVAKGTRVKRNRSGEATRRKILDAAASVFAEKGVEGASLREIMIAAGVNIAAVNYYFGGKTDLLVAVVSERTRTLNNERIALLEAAKVHNGGVLSIEDWLRALVTPFVEAELSTDPAWGDYLRILNNLATTSDPEYRKATAESYEALRHIFMDALAGILPSLSAEEITWRFYAAFAAVRSLLTERERIATVSGGAVKPDDLQRAVSFVLPLLSAGLRLPPVEPKPTVN